MKKLLVLFIAISSLLATPAYALKISEIDVFGNQRISKGSILARFDVKKGQDVDRFQLSRALKSLYASGLYSDLKLFIDGQRLIIEVVEQPAIASVEVEGNSLVPQAMLDSVFREIGLVEGELLNRAVVENIRQELLRQYSGQGYYSATVTSRSEAKPNNRIDLIIDVVEGSPAKVSAIDIIGNKQLSDQTAEDQLLIKATGKGGFFQWISGNDDFNFEKFTASQKLLENYYKDQGFIRYNLDSSQILIDQNQHDMSLIMNISEGERYTVSKIKLAGDIELYRDELQDLINIDQGDYYSATNEQLLRREFIDFLGSKGYAFAKIDVQHDIKDESQTVALEYQIWPGQRVYVRKVVIEGNYSTKDEVLRREMVLMEGEVVTNTKLNRSRARLERLGFFNSVSVTTSRVEGTNDQLDVLVKVEEGSNGTITGTLGWQGSSGFYVQADYTQKNFLGMGTAISASINANNTTQQISLAYDDPYVLDNGVGFNGSIYYQVSDYSDTEISSYRTNKYGGKLGLSYPLTSDSRISYGLSYDHTDLFLSSDPVLEIKEFADKYGNSFNTIELWQNWNYSTLNSNLFNATSGTYLSLNNAITIPPGDLKYFKTTINAEQFFEVYEGYAIRLHSELGFGDAYGGESYPFFRNFYGGGPGSVRGFEQSSLGPMGTNADGSNGSAIGGNIRTEAGIEFVFPVPFVSNKKAWRTSLFIDSGNVYTTHCHEKNTSCESLDPYKVRVAAGLDINWRTPIGIPLNFTFAYPLYDQQDDSVDKFNFTLGITTF